ncbi:phosphodiesterase 4D interacting protein centrosomin isoform X2 [Haematobia irritans]|uniref:phosphodiesterase 4D interacting protein centrosomin isoform X2 n=1 Tax=Haematobia irritans TaxID=7368 RepID=UPI003F4FE43A
MQKSFIIATKKGNENNLLEDNGDEEDEKNDCCVSKDHGPFQFSDVDLPNQDGVGYRSPCVSLQQPFQGSTSPAGHGRSVREFEEQMATLRKENFNLKLRLYFIEESIPGYQQASNSSEGQETMMKQLIDARVEMEILRKEAQEKQDLLKEAAQAMTQMEKIQKDTELKYQEMIDELKHKIQYLEMDREMEKSKDNAEMMSELMGRSEIADNMNALQRIRELEDLLKQSDEKLEDFQHQISNLDEILAKRDETIREYEEKVKELAYQNSELLESAENKNMELATKERSFRSLRCANAQLKSEIEKLNAALKIAHDNSSKEMSSIEIYENKIRNQEETINRMETHQLKQDLQKCKMEIADKMCIVQELEDKLSNRDQLYDKARFTIQKLMSYIKNQQGEINRLKNNNSSQASTSMPNNEKEINSGIGISGLEVTGFCPSLSDSEAMNDLSSSQKQKYENIIEQQEAIIQTLKADVKKKTADLQNFVNKELWEKNREIERLNKMINNGSMTSPTSPPKTNVSHDTAAELQQSFSDIEYSKALQRNKLLQRKVDILLQRLGTERNTDAVISQLRTELKQARSDAEHADKWRRQCADLCSTLSTRLEELAGFLNSLLKHKDVLGVLAVEKRKAMRRAVDRSLDLSKSLNMTLSVSGLSMIDQSLAELHNLSDILGDVDLGLANETFNSHEELHAGSQMQSIETLKAENKALKKELDKRRNAESKKERRSLPLSVMLENRESESEAWSEPDRKVSLARIGLEDHSTSLLPPAVKEQPSVHPAETDSDFSESALLDSRAMKSRNQEKINQLEHIIQQRDNRILQIQCQLVDADNLLKKEKLRVEEVTNELEELRIRNKELHDDLVAIGSQESSSNELNESTLLQQIEEKSRSLERLEEERERLVMESRLAEMQINSMKDDMENMRIRHEEALRQANEKEEKHLAQLRQEMETILEQSLQAKEEELENHRKQLSDLQRQYMEAQRIIECLQENEQELKQALVDSEMTSRNLQKQIDESTLRASKATTERVKALNDKLQLEKRFEELSRELAMQQIERDNLQQEIHQLQSEQKSLVERLAIAEAQKTSINPEPKRGDVSGYTSEEVPMPSAVGHAVLQQRIGEQRTQNYSPDLGIESDAGRISSAELSSAQMPLLKTVEISPSKKEDENSNEEPSDSSLENIKPSNVPATSADQENATKKHDCAKVDQENAELRRKLLRTKRAFEDTYEKLRNANQRKAQIEKDIKNQILKTHNVLKNVRSNMENEL